MQSHPLPPHSLLEPGSQVLFGLTGNWQRFHFRGMTMDEESSKVIGSLTFVSCCSVACSNSAPTTNDDQIGSERRRRCGRPQKWAKMLLWLCPDSSAPVKCWAVAFAVLAENVLAVDRPIVSPTHARLRDTLIKTWIRSFGLPTLVSVIFLKSIRDRNKLAIHSQTSQKPCTVVLHICMPACQSFCRYSHARREVGILL